MIDTMITEWCKTWSQMNYVITVLIQNPKCRDNKQYLGHKKTGDIVYYYAHNQRFPNCNIWIYNSVFISNMHALHKIPALLPIQWLW